MEELLKTFELSLAEAMHGTVGSMDEVMCYLNQARGKRVRPRLVFLSAKLFGAVNESTWRTALFAEMLHTATLIHDDVVDVSDMRRGQASVNARWGNLTAVLSGDYLLTKAMMMLSEPSDHRILQEMLRTGMAMVEGEMEEGRLQVAGGRRRMEDYLELITRKTALLIRSCCVGGALSVGASEEQLRLVGTFGLNLGRVFQMRDDILDADDAEGVVWAEQLMPEYLKKTMEALDVIAPMVHDTEALSSLRELAVFSAQREF